MEVIEKRKSDYNTILNGLMLLNVICVHCAKLSRWQCSMVLYLLAYCLSFMVQWMFYKSGSFFKHVNGNRIKHYWNKYMTPFIIFGLFGLIVQCAISCIGYGMPFRQWSHELFRIAGIQNTVFGNNALWFLPTLFLVRSVSDLVLAKIHPFIIAIISMLLAYLHFLTATPITPWLFGNFFIGLCFFSLGFYMKKYESKSWINVMAIVVYAIIILLAASSIYAFPAIFPHSNHLAAGKNEQYLLSYPIALCGIIAINAIFRWLSKHYSFPVLSYIGRNAMNFYVTHWIVLVVVKFVAEKHFGILGTKLCFCLFVAVCALTLPLISKLINSIKEKKVCTTTSRQEGC